MSEDRKNFMDLTAYADPQGQTFSDPETAHVVVHGNEVLGLHGLPGLIVEPHPIQDGVEVNIRVAPVTRLRRPVQLCFGMLPATGRQQIRMHVSIGAEAEVGIIAHCVFPNAVDVEHRMEAEIRIGPGAVYRYFERHIHDEHGGVQVIPKARIHLDEGARFATEFELLQGRVGRLDIDYEVQAQARSTAEILARINGRADDQIRLNESAYLNGEGATGVLTSKIALRQQAKAEVHNRLVASAAHARGHVDCKEIVRDQAVATAVPIVEVRHPEAHVTHEAAIGSVDTKQLETLMSRGLDEDAAVELIIQGLLSRS